MIHFSKNFLIGFSVGVVVFIALLIVYLQLFSAPGESAESERFIIPLNSENSTIIDSLHEEGFIKRSFGFKLALKLEGKSLDQVIPGGYSLSKSMSVWAVARALFSEPYMKWLVIPEGYRKEQIADLLQNSFGWSDEVKNEWVTVYTAMNFDYVEGVYFPDTYLIPVDEEPLKIAERFQSKFNEKLATFSEEALRQNIKWTTLVKLASIIQREAGNKDDMPLVAGILWNRLLKGQRLEADATLQYIKGSAESGWWPVVVPEDKKLDSPYNTYKTDGLPPHPISNPGIDAMNAMLYPEETKCFFYIHDGEGNIHCSETYEEHKMNIEKYL